MFELFIKWIFGLIYIFYYFRVFDNEVIFRIKNNNRKGLDLEKNGFNLLFFKYI